MPEKLSKRRSAAPRRTSQRYEGRCRCSTAEGKIADKRWVFTRLGSHGASKAVLRFTAPAEVKGVALLIVNHPDRASDQWMWTPALQRERRIAVQDRSTRFFGTDFSFEDLEERDVNQFDYRLLGEQPIDGARLLAHRIGARPRKRSRSTPSPRSGFGRTTTPSPRSRATSRTSVVRRLKYSDFVQVQGIWTARRLEMTRPSPKQPDHPDAGEAASTTFR